MKNPGATELERALEGALQRALRAPEVPHAFRTRLDAAVSRAAETHWVTTRQRMEKERREQLEKLQAQYVRVRRATLVTLLGSAFAAGAAAVIAMPWLRSHLGVYAPMAIAWSGVVVGVGITFHEPLRTLLRRWSDVL